jgi:aspartate dehydrogenase
MIKINKKDLKVGIAGIGTVGLPVARWLDSGEAGLKLTAVSTGNKDRALQNLNNLHNKIPIVEIEELAMLCDVIVECALPQKFFDIANPVLRAGRTLILLSATSLLKHMSLIDLARKTGGRIIIPSGAILGLDAVRTASLGTVHSVTMITRKPPKGLKKAPFIIEKGIKLEGLTKEKLLYEGPVTDAAEKFPANVNVAVALSLAGIGPEKTRYQVWADPTVIRNTHIIKVEADTASFEMTIGNVPTEENPATGKIVCLSVIETLRGLVSPFKVGT